MSSKSGTLFGTNRYHPDTFYKSLQSLFYLQTSFVLNCSRVCGLWFWQGSKMYPQQWPNGSAPKHRKDCKPQHSEETTLRQLSLCAFFSPKSRDLSALISTVVFSSLICIFRKMLFKFYYTSWVHATENPLTTRQDLICAGIVNSEIYL